MTVLISIALTRNYFLISILGFFLGLIIIIYPFFENKYSNGFKRNFSNKIVLNNFWIKNVIEEINICDIKRTYIKRKVLSGDYDIYSVKEVYYELYVETDIKQTLIIAISDNKEGKLKPHIILIASFLCENFNLPQYYFTNK